MRVADPILSSLTGLPVNTLFTLMSMTSFMGRGVSLYPTILKKVKYFWGTPHERA
jgi:hypothetical protein